MAIKAIVEKLDDVDEKYRDLYTERNGKFEVTAIEGMKTQGDVDRVSEGLRKEKEEHKKTKERWSILADKKPEDIIASLDRIAELEAAAGGKLDEVKINDLVEKRIGSKTAPLERKIKELTTQVGERDGIITGFKTKEQARTVQDSIKEAIGKAQGFQTVAIEDAILFGERHLTIDESGKVVTKDGVGVTPGVDASVWLTEMQSRKPHWWGETSGGGAGGNRTGGGNAGTNPWSHDGWNMTEQGRIFSTNPSRAEQLAKSAGHSSAIGARRPPPKK